MLEVRYFFYGYFLCLGNAEEHLSMCCSCVLVCLNVGGKKAFCLPVPWTPAQIEALAKGRLNTKLHFQIKLYDIFSCIKLNFICQARFRQIKELSRNRLCILVVNICRAGTALGPQSRKTQRPHFLCAFKNSLCPKYKSVPIIFV